MEAEKMNNDAMIYRARSFEHLKMLRDFSNQVFVNHLTLYQGYVKNGNQLATQLMTMVKLGKAGTMEYAELKRRFGWEFSGMRLHEYYFESHTVTATALDRQSQLYSKIAQDFGGYDLWKQRFKGTEGMRGIGWVILAYDIQARRLFNAWLEEHDAGLLVDALPLLVMDMFEHAFLPDYRLKRQEYVEAFFNVIDWGRVEKWLADRLRT